MEKLSQRDKDLLSFPDCIVKKMTIDLINKVVEIETNSCWISSYEGLAENCSLSLTDWDNFEIYKHNSSSGENVRLAAGEIDYLDEIPVFTYEDDNIVVIEGHGLKNKAWMIFKFYNPKIDGTYGPKLKD